tara:strand:- start:19001 stop:19852 length:852 start_codon:yes stop_codon:yes gene_type:complete
MFAKKRWAVTAAFILTLSISLLPNQAFAKRYVNAKDHEVDIYMNEYSQYEVDGDDLKVLVWNMYKGEKPNWKRDYAKLSKGKDILLLQELYLSPLMLFTFFEDEGRGYHMATSFFDTKKLDVASGVATASHAQPVRQFWQRSHYKEPFIKTPKMAIFNEYDLKDYDKNLMTVNLHAINFVSARKLKHMLVEIEKVLAKHDGPIVYGGDFNTWSKKKTRYLMDSARRLGLTEIKFKKDDRMRTFGRILDYVFVKGFHVNKSIVYGDIDGSDHKAMEVHLSLKRD